MLTVVDSAVKGGEGLQLYPQGETGGGGGGGVLSARGSLLILAGIWSSPQGDVTRIIVP